MGPTPSEPLNVPAEQTAQADKPVARIFNNDSRLSYRITYATCLRLHLLAPLFKRLSTLFVSKLFSTLAFGFCTKLVLRYTAEVWFLSGCWLETASTTVLSTLKYDLNSSPDAGSLPLLLMIMKLVCVCVRFELKEFGYIRIITRILRTLTIMILINFAHIPKYEKIAKTNPIFQILFK